MIRISKYPDYEEINPKLIEWIDFLPNMGEDEDTNLYVHKRTPYNCYPSVFKELGRWVLKTFQISEPRVSVHSEIWGAVYSEGHYAKVHTHGDDTTSFVYYVNAPPGSSPIVFPDLGKQFDPEPGLCIVFDGKERHEVPENNSHNRIIIAGNFYTK